MSQHGPKDRQLDRLTPSKPVRPAAKLLAGRVSRKSGLHPAALTSASSSRYFIICGVYRELYRRVEVLTENQSKVAVLKMRSKTMAETMSKSMFARRCLICEREPAKEARRKRDLKDARQVRG